MTKQFKSVHAPSSSESITGSDKQTNEVDVTLESVPQPRTVTDSQTNGRNLGRRLGLIPGWLLGEASVKYVKLAELIAEL